MPTTLDRFFAYVVWRGDEHTVLFNKEQAKELASTMQGAGWKDVFVQALAGSVIGEAPDGFPYPLGKQDTYGYSVWCRTLDGVWYEADRGLSTALEAQQMAETINRTGAHYRGRFSRAVGLAVPVELTRSRMTELEPKSLG